jgi:hypothetical protein
MPIQRSPTPPARSSPPHRPSRQAQISPPAKQAGRLVFSSLQNGLRAGWKLIDSISLFLSPFAILVFLIFALFALDAFGSHVQFVRSLDQEGIVTTVTWEGLYNDRKTVSVELDNEENKFSYVYLDLKYYTPSKVSSLQAGQRVKIRYTQNIDFAMHGVLEDEFDQVRIYFGYLETYFWPLFTCWGILVLHPELLFVGLTGAEKAPAPEKEPQP